MDSPFMSGFFGAIVGLAVLICATVAFIAISDWWANRGRRYCDCGAPLVWGAKPTRKTNIRTGETKTTYLNAQVCEKAFTIDSYLRGQHYGWDAGTIDTVFIGPIDARKTPPPERSGGSANGA